MADDPTTRSLLIDLSTLSTEDLEVVLAGAPIRVVGFHDSDVGKIATVEVIAGEDDEGRDEPDHDLSLEYPDEDLGDGGWFDSSDFES